MLFRFLGGIVIVLVLSGLGGIPQGRTLGPNTGEGTKAACQVSIRRESDRQSDVRKCGKASKTHHYLYVITDGAIYIYNVDRRWRLVRKVHLSQLRGVRGAVAGVASGMLYISYGGDGGRYGYGSMLAYNLITNRVVWSRKYEHGIDSMDISPDGKRIYMPDGELSPDGTWYVEDARTGRDIGNIKGGKGPHNTIVSLNGKDVYLGARNYDYLDVAHTSTNLVFRRIGPLRSGVRPFTINASETLAFTTATGFLGFQVSNIQTGKVLYTVSASGFTWDPRAFEPS